MGRRVARSHDRAVTTEQPNGASSAAQPAARPLRRRATDRVIAGVAAGIGDYFNVDPLLVRAAFVGLMIFGGAGLVLYVGAWLLIPVEGENHSIAQSLLHRLGMRPGSVAVSLVLMALLVFLVFGLGYPVLDPGYYLGSPVVLLSAIVLLGVLLLRRGGSPTAAAPFPDESRAETLMGRTGLGPGRVILIAVAIALFLFWFLVAQGGHWPAEFQVNSALVMVVLVIVGIVLLLQRGGGRSEAVIAEPGATVAGPLDAESRIARPRVPRGPLGWYTLAAALLGIGLLALVDNATDATVVPAQFLGLALAIVGIGLVIGSWWGNARLLILPALLLVPIAWVASYVTVPLEGGTGDHRFAPVAEAELRDEYRLVAGQLSLDLRELDAGSEPVRITASVALGRLVVLLPPESRYEITSEVGLGASGILGNWHGGTDVEDRYVRGETGPRFVLDLAAGIGEVAVYAQEGISP